MTHDRTFYLLAAVKSLWPSGRLHRRGDSGRPQNMNREKGPGRTTEFEEQGIATPFCCCSVVTFVRPSRNRIKAGPSF